MGSSPHPLEPLLGPLRYACTRDFANLKALKDLRTPLAATVARARGQVPPAVAAALEQELSRIDAADPAARRQSVLRVIAVLRGLGLDVSFAPGPPGEGAHPVQPERSPAQPERSPAQPERSRGPLDGASGVHQPVETPGPPPLKPSRPPRAAKARKAPGPEAEAPAKILSIAPREGPLAASIREVGWRVNPRLLGLLERKGVRKVGDVLFLLPRVYDDRRQIRKIAQLRAGERATILAQVRRTDETHGRGKRQFRAVLADSSGSIAAVFFQSGPWLKGRFPVGKRLVVSGEARQSPWGWEMPHPEIEPADDADSSPIHFNRIVPVYPGFERYEQRALRELAYKIVAHHADAIEDPLSAELRRRLALPSLADAVRRIHFPADDASLLELDEHRSLAHQRLAFDELFFLQLGMALRRQGVKVLPGIAFDTSPGVVAAARALLPFTLTAAQERVVAQLVRDMARPEPMNRLLQGDVGSGKTAVAVVAAAIAVAAGYQVAVMTPTEILAEQHFRTFGKLLAPTGAEVALVTGSSAGRKRSKLRARLASGEIKVAIGTHALIQGGVDFARLGLVVIDEQHRFGVIQRHALMDKGPRPDVLVMTATPIPRTLAMTLYGDLDVSVIDELPPGRTPIVTRVYGDRARDKALDQIRAELEAGHQAYVIYPLVEESEKVDLADATQGADALRAHFPTFRVGLLHGRMKVEEKDAVMEAFRRHELDVLVSTTVVEVGVDVPNASVMVIEHAERFGLSQLHQLRGRVGRGAARSYCFLLTGYALSQDARDRLAVMERSSDGFVIAEKDLEIRGPGEFLGTRQSGTPELAVANLVRDQALLARAQEEARAIIERDPRLEAPEHQALVKALEERWEGRLKLARVG